MLTFHGQWHSSRFLSDIIERDARDVSGVRSLDILDRQDGGPGQGTLPPNTRLRLKSKHSSFETHDHEEPTIPMYVSLHNHSISPVGHSGLGRCVRCVQLTWTRWSSEGEDRMPSKTRSMFRLQPLTIFLANGESREELEITKAKSNIKGNISPTFVSCLGWTIN